MKNTGYITLIYALLSLTLVRPQAAMADQAEEKVQIHYLYDLSDFMGAVPYSWANIFLDKEKSDVFAVGDGSAPSVQTFDSNGMKVYSFGDDGGFGNINICDGAVDKDGNIILLAYGNEGGATRSIILLCDYRGDLVARVPLKGIPAESAGFSPNRVVYQAGRLYLADLNAMEVVVAAEDGQFISGYNLPSLLKLTEKQAANTGMAGFGVDEGGDLLFTIPALFTAYTVTSDLKVSSFGVPGNAPGKFSVISGIGADDRGNYYVVDKLKCAVMVFDKDFKFLAEFGTRGYGPGGLIAPTGLIVGKGGKVYVSQGGSRGISVFGVSYN